MIPAPCLQDLRSESGHTQFCCLAHLCRAGNTDTDSPCATLGACAQAMRTKIVGGKSHERHPVFELRHNRCAQCNGRNALDEESGPPYGASKGSLKRRPLCQSLPTGPFVSPARRQLLLRDFATPSGHLGVKYATGSETHKNSLTGNMRGHFEGPSLSYLEQCDEAHRSPQPYRRLRYSRRFQHKVRIGLLR